MSAYGIRDSRPTPTDSRIRIMVYSPDDVFKFTGYYGYQASIELAKDEEVTSISMGDTTGWIVNPSGYRIFLKPIERDATTNMTMITNKRTYFFELYAEDAQDIRDPNMVFNVRFLYPDEANDDSNLRNFSIAKIEEAPDLSHPEKYNFEYSISGPDDIAPIKVFDDGEFTYMQFRDKNAEIPAIFAVDAALRESMVNYHLNQAVKNLIIIEHVFPKLSLRIGKKVLCVYNETYPDRNRSPKRSNQFERN